MPGQRGRLAGRVAVTAGAASGIGAATSLRFAAEGAKLCLFDQDAERFGKVASQVGDAGAAFVTRVGDVSEEADVEGCLASAMELGPPGILVNQAGIIWRVRSTR